MDIFDWIGAIGALLGAYATWKSYKLGKADQEFRTVKLNCKISKIAYARVPDTEWHKISCVLTNISPTPALLQDSNLRFHEKDYKLTAPENLILSPYEPTEVLYGVACWPNDILDGRYPATIEINTDKSKHTFQFEEYDIRKVFIDDPSIAN